MQQIVKKPIVRLLSYQRRWLKDRSRLKIALKGRQTGYTFATMLDLVLRCSFERKQRWYYLSLNEKRSIEAISYADQHCYAISTAIKQFIRERDGKDFNGWTYKSKQLSIDFPNGSQIIGLTSNATNARGINGNVVLDEFAHHADSGSIYDSLYPATTRGHHLIILSTPFGKQGTYYDLWEYGKRWSRHKCSIYDAIDDGLNVDLDELRAGTRSEDTWLQEYCCEFLDAAASWLPIDLIKSGFCKRALCTFNFDGTESDLYLGVDMARKRDLCVIWVLAREAERYITRGVICLQNAKFPEIRETIDRIMPRVSKCCIDNGITGQELTEWLQDKWGGKEFVEGVPCQVESIKASLATIVKDKLQEEKLSLPDDSDILADLHAIRRFHTDRGTVSFDAPRTRHGHADRFWALGLALRAAISVNKRQPMEYDGGESIRDWNSIASGSAHRIRF